MSNGTAAPDRIASGSVALLTVRNGEIGLVLRYRAATGGFVWEIPRCGLEDGPPADPTAAALGELSAQLCVDPGDVLTVHDLGRMTLDSSFQGPTAWLVGARLAPNCSWGVPPRYDISNVRFVALKEVGRMIDTGKITDSFTMAGLYTARRKAIIKSIYP